MKSTYVTAVQQLEISGDLARGDKIDENTFITNDRDVIKNIIQKELIPIIGTLEHNYIIDSPAVIYGNYEISDFPPADFLIDRLYRTVSFFHTLWLYSDNNVNNELGFLIYPDRGHPRVDSNAIAIRNSRADGSEHPMKLSREQLRDARAFARGVLKFETQNVPYVTRLEKEHDRVSRAFYQLQPARTTQDLAYKVMHYCSTLETLFATSQAELSHQLAERIAFFLESTGEARLNTYRLLKKAYGYRSQVTHGAAVATARFDELTQLSVKCDSLVRRSLKKILSKDDIASVFSSDEQMNEYFLRLILGA